jgi:hypothetical protein
MWMILFSLAFAEAACFGVAAVVLAYSMYRAPESARRAWVVIPSWAMSQRQERTSKD